MIARLLAAAALFTTPAIAQDSQRGPQDQDVPKRIRSVLLHGEEKCPKPKDAEEVVVCASAGDSPYRIPKRFRDKPTEGPAGQAWTNRFEVVEEVNRAGLPNSCSPVGSGGQTGCTRQMIQRWAQEKLERERREAAIP